MKTSFINFAEISREPTLRNDYIYQTYLLDQLASKKEYYSFTDLFEISEEKISVDQLTDSFKYCQISDVNKDGVADPVELNFNTRNLLEENYYKKIEKGDIMRVDKDDILMSFLLPQDINTVGKFIRISEELTDTYFTKAFIRIKAKIIPEVMFYCLKSIFYKDILSVSRIRKGYTGYSTLSSEDLANAKFDKRIVDILVSSYETIKADILSIEQKIAELDLSITKELHIIDGVFQDEFGFDYATFSALKKERKYQISSRAFSNNPDLRFSAKFHRKAGEFVISQLNALTNKKIKNFLVEPITLGASVSPSDFDENGEAYYVSMATIKTLKIDLDDTQLLSSAYFVENIKKILLPGDIIIARSGVAIGKTALVKTEFPGIFADFTMRVRLSNYNPEFAYYYFRTSYFQYLIEIYKKGLQNQNIFPIVIQEFPMLDIPLDKQQRIVDEIHSAIETQNHTKRKIAELRTQITITIEDTIAI